MRDNFFAKKRMNTLLFCAFLLVITLIAIIVTDYNVIKGFTSIPKAAEWAATNFYPNEKAMKRLPAIISSLSETILVSIASTAVAAVFALLFAIAGSHTTGVGGVFSFVSRSIATLFRNIDVAAWSMILLISFGQNVLTGYFALFFGSFGFLTRAFMESIDEVSNSSVEALRSTGAGYFPIIFQSVIPASIPQLLSWVLFMVETNIRQATLIGILTGTGIGFLFSLYYKGLNYSSASLVVIVIVLAIFAIESVSTYVRRVIL
ncbi:ABC transporter permease subunit [Paenibacillus sp. CGMCC 1.16610]|uniref:ABC transporter permease subunit n=2 Tax=Paenibacillus TaxID=44249 RepID=A0ABU6DKL0_9BACL|nr:MULTISPECIES: ABC transporter permease subunit [Paenibacillus]MBA2940689.1 ABC transporter permease subunit [Paenibacillus sp. CGMCC 1.16610]MCY9657903.1 ABC transporter permease subunit [Paenibacillus anseongense]MEB4797870.1 ABC transporter permease subunit [Paenibacillus chondroitinus]MVQ37541.1 ABC transporter permease subunit [Paenibacillus anseongense]